MNRIALFWFGMLALIVASCSRPDRFTFEQVQEDAAANRFEQIDEAISEGKSYRLLVISDALSALGSEAAVDRLVRIAANPGEGIRYAVFTHTEQLSKGEAQRVLEVLAKTEDATGAKARQRLAENQYSARREPGVSP